MWFFFAYDQLFDKIRAERPGVAENKIVPVLGDLSEIRLGVSDDDYNTLVRNVSIVFHVAATVRFDESIRDAVFKNVRGTREVVALAEQMKNLVVSTILLQCSIKIIDGFSNTSNFKKLDQIEARVKCKFEFILEHKKKFVEHNLIHSKRLFFICVGTVHFWKPHYIYNNYLWLF